MGCVRCFYRSLKDLYLNAVNVVKKNKKNSSLFLKGNDVVLFYLPSREVASGGILSIYFLMENTRKLFPNLIVLPVIMGRIQHYFKVSWFNNDDFIYNLLDIKYKLLSANSILVHVPEDFFTSFSNDIEKYSVLDLASKFQVNILNQNELFVPSAKDVFKHKNKYASLTMTLAFEKNKSNTYPYLDRAPYLLSSWFYGNDVEFIPFEQKENICIISPDMHPLKVQIVNNIKKKMHLECVEIRNMKFDDFKALQRRAKWSVTFGEGFDGYSGAAYLKGGIGFGVYDSNFFPDALKNDLPEAFFSSYEDMLENICEVMTKMNEKEQYEVFVKKMQSIVLSYNSPKLVCDKLLEFYEKEFVN